MSSSRLTCDVDWISPCRVVHLHGCLDLTTAAVVRSTVLKCLADEPTAVILDLTNLTCGDDLALMVLPALARAAAAWPAIPLLAHSAAPAITRRMQALAITRTVTLLPDAAAATTHISTTPGPTVIRLDLTDDPDDLARARHTARDVCTRTGRPHNTDTAELIVTELAANALQHATGPRSITISSFGYQLHIAVRDTTTQPPHIHDTTHGQHGRGMHIIEALSTAWGSTLTNTGKVVWATVRPTHNRPANA